MLDHLLHLLFILHLSTQRLSSKKMFSQVPVHRIPVPARANVRLSLVLRHLWSARPRRVLLSTPPHDRRQGALGCVGQKVATADGPGADSLRPVLRRRGISASGSSPFFAAGGGLPSCARVSSRAPDKTKCSRLHFVPASTARGFNASTKRVRRPSCSQEKANAEDAEESQES